jgi:hypothetical protein
VPVWLIILLAVILVFAFILFFIAYGYCLIKDRDALRSETYSIQKMAIERGIIGDSSTGYVQVNNSQPSTQQALLMKPQEEAQEDDNE